jgi:C4-dicarboxylate-specific signal transduction histidine kinase
VAEILTASRRIAEFVASLKRFAAPSADEKVENLDINDAVRAAARWVTHEIKVRECRLEWKLADELPPVRGSIRRLEQVFVNLLQNAAHAALRPGTLIEVTTTFDRRAQTVVVCIRDEGRGIPAENADRIFDPFFTTRREDGGTGLGLSISQTIVRAHDGSLRVESEPGQGTRAIVSLPTKGEVSDVG